MPLCGSSEVEYPRQVLCTWSALRSPLKAIAIPLSSSLSEGDMTRPNLIKQRDIDVPESLCGDAYPDHLYSIKKV